MLRKLEVLEKVMVLIQLINEVSRNIEKYQVT